MGTDETLAWEARQRPRAAAAALAAPVLIIAGYFLPALILPAGPVPSLVDALQRAAAPGSVGDAPSVRTASLEYFVDHVPGVSVGLAVQALGFVLMALALTLLAFATRARVPEFPRVAVFVPAFGGLLTAIYFVLRLVAGPVGADAFLDGARTVDDAGAIAGGALNQASLVAEVVATFALALGFMLVSLNAMRAGLLTRFMGILGILCGVLLLLQSIGRSLPIVQCLWLGALAALFAGRWPGGMPPAWRTGKREPWPTQQELREARDRAQEPAVAAASGPAPAATLPAHPSSKKRKRKRRR